MIFLRLCWNNIDARSNSRSQTTSSLSRPTPNLEIKLRTTSVAVGIQLRLQVLLRRWSMSTAKILQKVLKQVKVWSRARKWKNSLKEQLRTLFTHLRGQLGKGALWDLRAEDLRWKPSQILKSFLILWVRSMHLQCQPKTRASTWFSRTIGTRSLGICTSQFCCSFWLLSYLWGWLSQTKTPCRGRSSTTGSIFPSWSTSFWHFSPATQMMKVLRSVSSVKSPEITSLAGLPLMCSRSSPSTTFWTTAICSSIRSSVLPKSLKFTKSWGWHVWPKPSNCSKRTKWWWASSQKSWVWVLALNACCSSPSFLAFFCTFQPACTSCWRSWKKVLLLAGSRPRTSKMRQPMQASTYMCFHFTSMQQSCLQSASVMFRVTTCTSDCTAFCSWSSEWLPSHSCRALFPPF